MASLEKRGATLAFRRTLFYETAFSANLFILSVKRTELVLKTCNMYLFKKSKVIQNKKGVLIQLSE